MEKDMTIGSPIKLLILFALPLFFGNIFQQFYTMVDTIIVGRFVGANALAAVGSTYGFTYLSIGFATGLGAGFGVIISQNYGAKNFDIMRKAYAQSITLALICGLILTSFFLIFSKPLLILIKTPENIINYATRYITYFFIGLIATIFYNFFASVLRAIGDSKSPLLFLIISSILNIGLDLLFVIVFGLGIVGVAIATAIAQAISAILCFIYIRKKSEYFHFQKGDFKFDKELSKKLLKIGLPAALNFSVIAIGVIIVQIAINNLGNSDYIAAYSVGGKIKELFQQALPAIGLAMSTYAAQNLGAGKIDRISKGFRAGVLLIIIYSLIALLLSFVLAKPIGSLFLNVNESVQNQNVMQYALQFVRTSVPFFIPLGMIFLFRNGCQGLGSAIIPIISSSTELVLRIFAAFFLSGTLGLGYTGICFASPSAWVAAAIILPICYFSRMKRIKNGLVKI